MAGVDTTNLGWIPSLTGTPPPLDLTALPQEPVALFGQWLTIALERGVPEPVSATLATVDADGVPDARTLVLQSVDADGWSFIARSSTRKVAQLAARPQAALDLYWQPLRRAVRARGPVLDAAAPGPGWRAWRLRPARVEFWEGHFGNHLRIVFLADGAGWRRQVWRGETREA